MKLLRNINPLGHVNLPVAGRVGPAETAEDREPGSGCLAPREEFEVSDQVAGRGPFWRPLDPDTDETNDYGQPLLEWRNGEDGLEVHDLGFGLLAQVDNYELVKPAAKKAASAKRGS